MCFLCFWFNARVTDCEAKIGAGKKFISGFIVKAWISFQSFLKIDYSYVCWWLHLPPSNYYFLSILSAIFFPGTLCYYEQPKQTGLAHKFCIPQMFAAISSRAVLTRLCRLVHGTLISWLTLPFNAFAFLKVLYVMICCEKLEVSLYLIDILELLRSNWARQLDLMK